MGNAVLTEKDVEEKLADAIHDQWAHWTKHMLNNLTPENIERWKKQIDTPYASLSEKEKDSDREFAKKFIALIDRTRSKVAIYGA